MKKILAFLLAAMMVLAFAACGNNGGTPAGDKVTDPLEVLNKTWSSLPEDYKFPAAGGDNNHPAEDKPGTFDISDADSLDSPCSRWESKAGSCHHSPERKASGPHQPASWLAWLSATPISMPGKPQRASS